jgi:hypothetical protein
VEISNVYKVMETFRVFKDKPAAEDLVIWFGDRGLAAE